MTSATPTGLDFLAAIIVFIIFSVSALTLLGMGVMMAVGAIFSNRPLVTSWPENQEHAFAPYERRGATANSTAWVVSLIGAVIVTFAVTGIYFGVAPDKKNIAKDMNMSNLTKKRTPAAPAVKPDAPKADPAAPAEAPAAPATPPAPEAPKP
jgi:hypothetical protein